jgi:pterin-4a-carbinolamine dehydratase
MKNSLNVMMSQYFNEADRAVSPIDASQIFNLREGVELPIAPSYSEWELLEEPSRLGRSFEFKSREQLRFFVDEIFEHEGRTGHEGKIIIEGNTIMIEIFTHDVNDVTELDTEYAETADEIYADALSAYE